MGARGSLEQTVLHEHKARDVRYMSAAVACTFAHLFRPTLDRNCSLMVAVLLSVVNTGQSTCYQVFCISNVPIVKVTLITVIVTGRTPDTLAVLQDPLVSKISRKSIELLKQHFKEDMTKDDWRLVLKLKKTFQID